MAFAEACTALPSYAKAESHYTGVGRAALALFSRNYVTAGISSNRFMMPAPQMLSQRHAMEPQRLSKAGWHSQPS